MITNDMKKLIFLNIPDSVTIKGEEVTVHKRYANQYAMDVFPAVTLNYSRLSDKVYDYLTMIRFVTQVATDEFEYRENSNRYGLSISGADSITGVTGTVSGVSYTFESSEYQLSNNGIEFLGPTYPDHETDFYVVYHHKLVRQFFGGIFYDLLSINSYAKTMAIGGKQVNGIVIAEAINDAVWNRLYFNNLLSDWIPTLGVLICNLSDAVDLDFEAGVDYVRRRAFDCQVRHPIEQEVDVESIETVDWSIKELVL